MKAKELVKEAFRRGVVYLAEAKGVTAKAIADACGVTERHIQGILSENEKSGAGKELSMKIAEIFGMDREQVVLLGQSLDARIQGNATAPKGNAATNPHNSPMVHANGCSSVSVQGEVHHHQGHPATLDHDESEILDMFRMIPPRERVAVLRDCRRTLMGTIGKLAERGTQAG